MIAGRLARGGTVCPGWVEVDGERLLAVGDTLPPRPADIVHAGIIAPGLLDLQVNGAAGEEVTGGEAALARIERALLARGVTRWLATVVTSADGVAARAVAAIERRMADPSSTLAGVHLEGPFLSRSHAGVHRGELLRVPADGLPGYYRSPALRLVTLAPELPGAVQLIAELRRRGVAVSLGHSAASAEQAREACAAGARLVTHLFNAMAPLHHRAPGLAGFALDDARITIGLIADGVHVDPLMLSLVRRLAGPRVALVSDASPLAASAERAATLAGVLTRTGPDGAPRAGDGRLAGSSILLDEAIRRWVSSGGARLADAIAAAAERPARAVGLPAGLTPGARADLALFDDRGRITRVMHRGTWLPSLGAALNP